MDGSSMDFTPTRPPSTLAAAPASARWSKYPRKGRALETTEGSPWQLWPPAAHVASKIGERTSVSNETAGVDRSALDTNRGHPPVVPASTAVDEEAHPSDRPA